MGWSSGSEIANEMINAIQKEVSDFKARRRIYKRLIRALEQHDWDTQDESLGIDDAFDAAYSELNS